MNNLKYYNDSLAYDFDLFMPHGNTAPAEQPRENIITMPERGKKTHKTASMVKPLGNSSFAVVMAAVLVLGACASIALRLHVNELNTQVNRAKSDLGTLQSQYVSMEMEYENRISYGNLEMEATALGMKRMDKNQVVYIRVNEACKAKNGDGEVLTAKH